MVNIVSLHGYNTSHESGFEEALYDAFSGDYDFRKLNLLGHGVGRESAEIFPIKDVISDAVDEIAKFSDDDRTVLIGTSFGAYPVLEYLRTHGFAAGAVFVKSMVDLEYTLNRCAERMGDVKDVLFQGNLLGCYSYGSVSKPFEVFVPSLLFGGVVDGVVGGLGFLKKRIVGDNLEYVALRGGHCDKFDDDIERVVSGTRSFLEHLN